VRRLPSRHVLWQPGRAVLHALRGGHVREPGHLDGLDELHDLALGNGLAVRDVVCVDLTLGDGLAVRFAVRVSVRVDLALGDGLAVRVPLRFADCDRDGLRVGIRNALGVRYRDTLVVADEVGLRHDLALALGDRLAVRRCTCRVSATNSDCNGIRVALRDALSVRHYVELGVARRLCRML